MTVRPGSASACRSVGPGVADAALLEVPPSLASTASQQAFDRRQIDVGRNCPVSLMSRQSR
jgi:hypothetical protein